MKTAGKQGKYKVKRDQFFADGYQKIKGVKGTSKSKIDFEKVKKNLVIKILLVSLPSDSKKSDSSSKKSGYKTKHKIFKK